jgi:aryl-phospho-beta-D-glucosidase BglC (GH1 family)
MGRLARVCLVCVALAGSAAARESKIRYWDAQRKGANNFNEAPSREWWFEAKAAGIALVRLAPNKWKSARRDFLVGDADDYAGLVEADFAALKRSLDDAQEAGVKVVLTMLTLPGSRYTQANGGTPDFRLWRDPRFLPQAARLWRDLARRLKSHPAIVGYNPLNEPVPERAAGVASSDEDLLAWHARVRGTPADLNRFDAEMIKAIRWEDRETPVVLDCGWWANASAVSYLKPAADDKTLYSIHVYNPFEYTNRQKNDGRFGYPGKFVNTSGEGASRREAEVELNRAYLERVVAPVGAWQKKYGVPASRIFVGEFGCNRTVAGAAGYLADLISIFDARGWHWAFYSFRDDGAWGGMDYELGAKPPGAAYWRAVERGERPRLPRVNNPLWDVLKNALRK